MDVRRDDLRRTHRFAAYQGEGWNARVDDLPTMSSAPSEVAPLRRAALFRPDTRWCSPAQGWNAVQYLRPVDFERVRRELDTLAKTLESRSVHVDMLDDVVAPAESSPHYNRMFMRDALWATPWGLVLARFASEVRRHEESVTRRYVDQLELPVLASVPVGCFEGADALWLSSGEVLLGVGNRTTSSAARFLRGMLSGLGVSVIEVALPRAVQHLLGMLQFVAADRVALRGEIAPRGLTELLRSRGFQLLTFHESDEITLQQGMNVVVVADGVVVMPDDVPVTRQAFERWGIETIGVPCGELKAAAGGLACATGIVRREAEP